MVPYGTLIDMKTVLIAIGIMLGIGAFCTVAYFCWIFWNMIFIAQITDKEVEKQEPFKIKKTGVQIEQIKIDIDDFPKPVNFESKPEIASKAMMINEDGEVYPGYPMSDDELSSAVTVIVSPYKESAGFVIENKGIYILNKVSETKTFTNSKGDEVEIVGTKGEQFFDFSKDEKFNRTTEGYLFDQRLLFVLCYKHDQQGISLLQINLVSKEVQELSNKIRYGYQYYESFRFFELGKNDTHILSYYTGNYSYAFGGDSSRPKKSHIRIYSDEFPNGEDLASFEYVSGMIVGAKYNGEDLLLKGDPSRPRQVKKRHRDPKYWRIKIN